MSREVEALKHDIARYVAIASEQATELADRDRRIDALTKALREAAIHLRVAHELIDHGNDGPCATCRLLIRINAILASAAGAEGEA